MLYLSQVFRETNATTPYRSRSGWRQRYIENCIPLCLNCHEEVGSYNSSHPIGRKFGAEELRRHRDLLFELVRNHPEQLSSSDGHFFNPRATDENHVLASVEPHYREVTVLSQDQSSRREEVFATKVRNKGTRSIFVNEIGFTCEGRRYPGSFLPYSSRSHREASEILPGHSQVFSFYGVKIEAEHIPKIDGIYLLTGSGDLFVNQTDSLERVIKQFQEEEPLNIE